MNHSAALYRGRKPCRCDTCREGHRRRYAAERAARHSECTIINGRRISTHPSARHGTAATYSYYGCQCEPCTRANSNECKKYRHRKGAHS